MGFGIVWPRSGVWMAGCKSLSRGWPKACDKCENPDGWIKKIRKGANIPFLLRIFAVRAGITRSGPPAAHTSRPL